ncbi:TonB-dependent receptor plug domain-containing protein [Flavihumibacter profundi]|uniref:TonB-dependent receptor plug domain-containing protein n=1 Tax=Flavihumibacter profundi TaxID=2716883 RepID=UPI001CC46E0B|nr:TonB-dependent receptor [Flavihumibacter profundi]MBZ5857643.1 TonB-dependent receptor [Flavihumibacter profundi]
MRKTVIPFLFAFSAVPAFAQQDTIALELEEVVVTSLRKKQSLLKTPYQVERVSGRYISTYQPRTTPEVLVGLNGVFVQKTNHGGGSPFVRGLTGNQLLVLVDGIRLNNSTFRYGPNQYLNTIDAFSVDHIEVAKGTGSVQYGSDALGGVIQVFTKEPVFSATAPRWKASATGKWMSGGMEQTGRAEMSYSAGKMAAQVGLSCRNFGDIIGGDTTGKQTPTAYDEMAWDARLKFGLSENTTLTIAHQFLQQNHVPVYHKVVLENYRINETNPQQRLLNYARLNINGKQSFAKQLCITASWQQTIEGRESSRNNSPVTRKEWDEVNTVGLTADLYSELAKNWTANSGIELYYDGVTSKRQDINETTGTVKELRGLYPTGSKYGNYSIYTLHHLSWKRFSAELGGRFNLFNIKLNDTSLGVVTLHPSTLVGNASVMYHLNDRHKVFVSLSNGFRAPNIDDMGTLGIVDFRYEVPTNDLRPEKSLNTELGYKFIAGKLEGTASVFNLQLKDLITRVRVGTDSINGYPVYQKENTERAEINGVEASLKYSPLSYFWVSANFAWQQGTNKTKGEPIRRIPPVYGRLMAGYTKNKWHAAAEWLLAGKQDRLAQGDMEDNRIPKGGTPGWNVVNLYGGYSWSFADLNLGLQNLLDEDYRTHGSGINGVGRSLWISLKIKINQ